jgi:hypothetical protein
MIFLLISKINPTQMKKYIFLFFIAVLSIFNTGFSQISGVVFRDLNNNGVKDNSATFNEPLVTGITVNVYNNSNTLVATVACTSNTATSYSFSAGLVSFPGNYRIEFINTALGDYPSFVGTGNNTNVQFINAASSAVNYAIQNPNDYSQNNPLIVTNSYVEGDAAATPEKQVLVSLPYTASGTTAVHNMEANHVQLGATWGLSYHKKTKTLFAAAYQKRHTSYGSGNSTGVIYKLPNPADGSTADVSIFLDLNVLYGSNIAGDNPHPNAITDFKSDDASYGLSGKISIGGIDLSEDEKHLWVVNLNDRQLYKVPVGPNLEAPTSAAQVTTYPLYNKCDCNGVGGLDGVADTDLRPFAVKAYRGKVYVGMVCTALSTPNDFTKLNAYVFSFDPSTGVFTQVLTFPLTYNRGSGNSAVGWYVTPIPGGYGGINTANWRPWDDTYSRDELSWYDNSFKEGGYPQPMLTDIEIDAAGNMHLGLRDRFGDMVGDGVNEPGTNNRIDFDAVGDILKANPSGGNWVLNITTATAGTEFYASDNYNTSHDETSNGGLAHLQGTTDIVNTVMDPVSNISFGLDFANTATGALPRSYQIYRRKNGNSNNDVYFAKSNGNGDVEFLCDFQPIQIGNRIWFDTNGNGIQDAGEAGINGVMVQLVSPGPDGIFGNANDVIVATTTTATINNQPGSYFFSALAIQDARKPNSWIGVNNILPGYDYQIRILNAVGGSQQAPLVNYQVTQTDINTNTNDGIDNDAAPIGTSAIVQFNTNNINHSFDIGFVNNIILAAASIKLNATLSNEDVILSWQTLNETNTAHFEIETSTDNQNFKTTGNTIPASVNSAAAKSYSFTHNISGVRLSGILYYRIKLYNANGTHQYSNTATIKLTGTGIKVWPNPFAEVIQISIESSNASTAQLRFIDASGRIILNQTHKIVKGINQLNIQQLHKLSKGNYVLEMLQQNRETIRFKLIK